MVSLFQFTGGKPSPHSVPCTT